MHRQKHKFRDLYKFTSLELLSESWTDKIKHNFWQVWVILKLIGIFPYGILPAER